MPEILNMMMKGAEAQHCYDKQDTLIAVFLSPAWWRWGNGQRLIFLFDIIAEDVIKQTYNSYSEKVNGFFLSHSTFPYNT